MFECRKIYGNLLLLSVMLFTLGASCRPLTCELVWAEQCYTQAADAVDFQWDNRSGSIVYRSGQLKATIGNEFVGLLPGTQAELTVIAGQSVVPLERFFRIAGGCCRQHTSRGPPEA